MFGTSLSKFIGRTTRTSGRRGRAAKGNGGLVARLAVEGLEDRTVPSFLPAVSYTAGTAPNAVTVGDFHGDGRNDLVAVNSASIGTVSVLLGNGDGSFQPAVASPAG